MRGNHAVRALGRLKPGTMNKLEAEYDIVLDARKHHGEIAWYTFEGITLKLADGCRYTPDFMVMLADGTLQVHECKGRWEEDARVKIKVAAAQFPFEFIAVRKRAKRDGGGFTVETF